MPLLIWLPLLLASAFALQPPGQFHADEPVARDGERWLALRVDGADAALIATTLQVRAVEDAVNDAPGQRTGLLVSSGNDAAVLMYLRGNSLVPGRLQAAAAVASTDDNAGIALPTVAITLGELRYRISPDCDAKPLRNIDGQPQVACRIVLEHGAQSQTLMSLIGYREHGARAMTPGDDAAPGLLFAGDIDRDGQLDLIFDTTDHYNVSRPVLFLSSQALPGALVGESARFEAVGC